MPVNGGSSTDVPRLLERPGKVSILFDRLDTHGGVQLGDVELSLPFRKPPRAALADPTRLATVLGSVVSAGLTVLDEAVDDWLGGGVTASARELTLDHYRGCSLLWGRLTGLSPAAWFSVRLYPRQEGSRLAVELRDPRVYGRCDRPAAEAVRRVVAELVAALPPKLARLDPAEPIVWLDPLGPALRVALASLGWKIPLMNKVVPIAWTRGLGASTLGFGRGEPGRSGLKRPARLDERLRRAERLLHAGQHHRAVSLWLQSIRERKKVRWCMERITQVLAVEPGLFSSPQKILDSFRAPDVPAVLLAEATMALAKDETSLAAERYETLARVPKDLTRERVLALTAAGQAMAQSDPFKAAVYFEEALALSRDHRPALTALASLPAFSETHSLLRYFKRLLAREGDPSRAASLHVSLGQLLLADGMDMGAARRHFERALGLDPSRADASVGLASALVARGGQEQGLALLVYLAQHFASQGMSEQAVRLLMRRGQLAAALPGMEDFARDSFERILDLDPDNQQAKDALDALQVQDTLSPGGDEVPVPSESLVTQVLRLTLEMQDDEQFPSLRAKLETALSQVEDWPAFLDGLKSKADAVEDRDIKIRILLEGGEICETRLFDPFEAEDWYWQVLELDKDNLHALDALLRLLGQREAWPSMVDLLLRRAAHAGDMDQWASYLIQCADILGRRMGEYERSLAVLDAVIQSMPEHWQGLSMKAYALEAMERFQEAFDVLASMEPFSGDDRLVQVLEREAHLLLGPLDRPGDGIQCLIRLLKIVPDHESALATIDDFYRERGNPKLELAVVERRLAMLMRREAGSEDDGMVKSTLFLRRARLRMAVRGDDERAGAIRDLEMAVKEWPGNAEAAEELARVYRADGNLDGLRWVLPILADLMLPGPARAEVEQELAQLGG